MILKKKSVDDKNQHAKGYGRDEESNKSFMGSVGTVPKSRVLYYITIPPFSFLFMAELMTRNSSYFLVNFPFYMLISSIPQKSAIKCSEAYLRKGVQTSLTSKQIPSYNTHMCDSFLHPPPPPRETFLPPPLPACLVQIK